MKKFNNPQAVKTNPYHPDHCLPMWKYDITRGESGPYGWDKKQPLEEYAENMWTNFLVEQLKILHQFLGKFDNE